MAALSQQNKNKNKKPVKKRKPPAASIKSLEYDLFGRYLGDQDSLSNTIELWDGIPKYFVAKQAQDRQRDDKGRLSVLEHAFQYKGVNCNVVIQPASIRQKDGSYKDYYPSAGEEMVEDVIRKIFTDQAYAHHDPQNTESWVRFSLQMIKKELAGRKKTRSVDQIKQSIEILSRSVISFYVKGEEVYTNPILADLTRVTRKDYIDDPTGHWMARLPALISKSVNELSYRQYNYALMFSLKSQLSRWLHKRLSHNYVNAGLSSPYEILLSSVIRDSGMLPHQRMNDRVKAFEATIDELVAKRILTQQSKRKEERRGKGNKIDDILFSLCADPAFIKDVKAANARKKHAVELSGFTNEKNEF